MTDKKEPKYLTVEEAAEILQMSTKTVRRRVADGSLKSARLGRLIRILEEELHKFMALPAVVPQSAKTPVKRTAAKTTAKKAGLRPIKKIGKVSTSA